MYGMVVNGLGSVTFQNPVESLPSYVNLGKLLITGASVSLPVKWGNSTIIHVGVITIKGVITPKDWKLSSPNGKCQLMLPTIITLISIITITL